MHNRINKLLMINKSSSKKICVVLFPPGNYFLVSTAFNLIHNNGFELLFQLIDI